MTAFSNYLENELIDHTLRNLAYTPPTNIYVGLFTASPTDANTGTEVSGGSYARELITFAAPVAGATSNDALVTFTTATASWGVVTHFGLYDSVSGGNLLYWGPLTVSKTVDSGDIFTWPIGNLAITLD